MLGKARKAFHVTLCDFNKEQPENPVKSREIFKFLNNEKN